MTTIADLFSCPISQVPMREPVQDRCGHTFDRESIEMWLAGGHANCPFSRQPLQREHLTPNLLARDAIALLTRNGSRPLPDGDIERVGGNADETEALHEARDTLRTQRAELDHLARGVDLVRHTLLAMTQQRDAEAAARARAEAAKSVVCRSQLC